MSWQCTVVIALHHFSSGDTLLAIRAPIGTQLEVPIPESVGYVSCILGSVLSSSHPCVSCITLGSRVIQIPNGQRKYQIHLKSATGPIEVLLVNKDPSSASPVVLAVPPPDEILQSLPTPAATPTSQPSVSQVCKFTIFILELTLITTTQKNTELPHSSPFTL